MSVEHIPVLLNEVLETLSYVSKPPRRLLDGTFGRGGHCTALLRKYPELCAVGVDRDETAHAYAHEHYVEYLDNGRLTLWKGSYSKYISEHPDEKFDLILLDLGVSSPQLDAPERGFSFYGDGPLDMRMGQHQITTAADIINTWPEEQLHEIFMEYGEIRSPYRVVRAIVNDRKTVPYTSTQQLASLIERVEGWQKKGRHPATQFFMALRLVVNQELEDLKSGLPLLIAALNPGGVIAVISFHSLEDRIAKVIFKEHSELGGRLNKKVIVPSDAEEKANPRSRSAKLRGFQKDDPEYSDRERY